VGTGLSSDAMRVSAGLLAAVPLPRDEDTWAVASELLATGDLAAFSTAATAMFDLPRGQAAAIERWWSGRRPR